jgi:hypothetical protein
MLQATRVSGSAPDAKPAFRCLIAYDDFELGLKSMQIYNAIVREFSADYEFSINIWKFDILQFEHIGRLAAEEASQADLIIMAMDDKKPLRPELESWVDRWISSKRRSDSALVALLGHSERPDHLETIRHYLKDMAREGEMSLLTREMTLSRGGNRFPGSTVQRNSGDVPSRSAD